MRISIDKLILDELFAVAAPTHILCGVVQHAMIQAHVENQGRDWRRVKREVNKAAERARRQRRSLPNV